MIAFANLLERLAYTPARNAKLRLMVEYFRATPDPDRGWALAALTDGLAVRFPARRTLLELIEPRVDAELYRLSRDYVGDTAETVALLWPESNDAAGRAMPPSLGEIADTLALIGRGQLGARLAAWLDALDANGRWALLKLLTGAPRVGVSARLAKTALAQWAARANPEVTVDDIEEVWHALTPPYAPLFAWCAGTGPRPDVSGAPVFRPLMLSHALEADDLDTLVLADFSIEWKWDGIRIQIACGGGTTRLYSRTGEDIGAAFPDIAEHWPGSRQAEGVFDGELLIVRDGDVAPFADLQKRLNRKSVTALLRKQQPAHVRLYDVLMIGGESASRRMDVPNFFVLVQVGLLLMFLALVEYLDHRWRRARKA